MDIIIDQSKRNKGRGVVTPDPFFQEFTSRLLLARVGLLVRLDVLVLSLLLDSERQALDTVEKRGHVRDGGGGDGTGAGSHGTGTGVHLGVFFDVESRDPSVLLIEGLVEDLPIVEDGSDCIPSFAKMSVEVSEFAMEGVEDLYIRLSLRRIRCGTKE